MDRARGAIHDTLEAARASSKPLVKKKKQEAENYPLEKQPVESAIPGIPLGSLRILSREKRRKMISKWGSKQKEVHL